MKRIVLMLAIALIGAATGMAQAPHRINYQGRAQDANGPVKTPRTVTLKLYADSASTVALWTEVHPAVNFTDGLYTIVIGSITPLPAAFDRQYWFGVAIQGVNAGAELPKLQLLATPYTIHAEAAETARFSDSARGAATAGRASVADSARVAATAGRAVSADTAAYAKAVQTPILLPNTGKGPTLTIGASTGGNALVTNGIDSTAKHYVSGENLDTGRAVAGGYYRDNAPLAWGVISQSGAMTSRFGISSVTLVSGPGGTSYEITLQNRVTAVAPAITALSLDGSIPLVAIWSLKQGSTDPTTFVVRFFTLGGQSQPSAFSVVVFGRPQ